MASRAAEAADVAKRIVIYRGGGETGGRELLGETLSNAGLKSITSSATDAPSRMAISGPWRRRGAPARSMP
jgi:hypothetical protein